MAFFGIFSPTLGIKANYPTILLPDSYISDSENTIVKDGELRRSRLRRTELLDTGGDPSAIGEAILELYWFVNTSSTGYLLAFTPTKAYHWNTSTKVWDLKFTAGGTVTRWSAETFGDQVIVTNGVDKVQYWNGSGSFANLGGASGIDYGGGVYVTRADFVLAFENYLLLGNTLENGVEQPRRLRNSNYGLYNDFATGDSGYIDVPDSEAELKCVGEFQDFLVLFTNKSTHRMWLVSSSDVFNTARISKNKGCTAYGSVVNGGDGELYFFDTNNEMSVMTNAYSSQPISGNMDPSFKQLEIDQIDKIRSTYIDREHRVCWAVPIGDSGTGALTQNNKIVTFTRGIWEELDIPASAFAKYQRGNTYTINTIPFDTIDEIGWETINSAEASASFVVDLVGGYDGITYTLDGITDNGNDYTSFFTLNTDLAGDRDLQLYKRLHFMTFWFGGRSSGTATILIREDFGGWQTAGTIDLSQDKDFIIEELPCDYYARNYEIRIDIDCPFRFLGTRFEFTPSGIAV